MKTPQIMIDRLKSITTAEKATHIAAVIEIAFNKKLVNDFDLIHHIIDVLVDVIDIKNFDYSKITARKPKELSQATKEKRYKEQCEKLAKKYGINIAVTESKEGDNE